jgi:DNA-binding beta-propeller fold protein YncE
MHMLPVLGALEEKRAGQPIAIIGVHSAKFDSEKDPAHVRAAVARYGIDHPVVVDADMAIWDRFGVQAWPTLVLIRPDGHVAGAIPGEVPLEALDQAVGEILDDARADGTLAKTQALPPRRPRAQPGALAYPGKVLAAADGRLFVSDSLHHRVLELGHDGRILEIIGSGSQGRASGTFDDARLDDPQGLAFDRRANLLYVADARGQTLWKADLARREILAIAGTGALGGAPFGRAQTASEAELRTPWDLALAGNLLYVAMAGSHQICVLDLKTGKIARFAGNGRETLADGPGPFASFAQPSGLALADGTLYVADSESSAVRAIDVASREVRTIVGTGLFDWGDRDGPLGPQMLQHPLAVAWSKGGLYVADSYNGKIKRFDPGFKGLSTVLVEAEGLPLAGPAGLAIEADGSLVVADTDRSRLLRLSPGAGAARSLPVRAAQEVSVLGTAASPTASPGVHPAKELPPRQLSTGVDRIQLHLVAPAGFTFSEAAPWAVELSSDGGLRLHDSAAQGEASAGPRVTIPLGLSLEGPGTLRARVHASVCDAVTHAACYPVRESFAVALRGGGPTSDSALDLPLSVPAGAAARAH